MTQAQWNVYIAAAIAANQTLISSGQVNGAINGNEFDSVVIGGDQLDYLFAGFTVPQLVTFSVIADGNYVFSANVVNSEPFVLPSGFNARRWEFEIVSRGVPINAIRVASSMPELDNG